MHESVEKHDCGQKAKNTLAENTWTVVGPWVIPGEIFGKMRKCKKLRSEIPNIKELLSREEKHSIQNK